MSISKFNSINKRKYMEGVIVLQNLLVILLITFSFTSPKSAVISNSELSLDLIRTVPNTVKIKIHLIYSSFCPEQ